jgi:NADH dehydrogenase (ubiquinone) 1 alpha subcomplex subunit 8
MGCDLQIELLKNLYVNLGRPGNAIMPEISKEDLPESLVIKTPQSYYQATSSPLLASSFALQSACKSFNDQFVACRYKHANPAACQAYAQDVLNCATRFHEHVKESPCNKLFGQFWKCLDMNQQNFIYCRREEFDFHDCVEEYFGWEKRLWKGTCPEEGLKEKYERPELDSWKFRYHAWSYKNKVPENK